MKPKIKRQCANYGEREKAKKVSNSHDDIIGDAVSSVVSELAILIYAIDGGVHNQEKGRY